MIQYKVSKCLWAVNAAVSPVSIAIVVSFAYVLELKSKTFEVSGICLKLDYLRYFVLVLSLTTHYFVWFVFCWPFS